MFSLYLLGAVVVVFFLQLAFRSLTQLFWLDPSLVFQQPWTLLTSMFLHGGFTHLFLNGLALYMFGPYLEQMVGSRRFLLVYFASGIVGGLAYVATYYAGLLPQSIPAVGASGAIYGILGAVAVLHPNLTVLMMGIFPMPMRHAAVMWVFIELAGTFDQASGVASAAHLGGLVVGFAAANYFKKRGCSECVADEYA